MTQPPPLRAVAFQPLPCPSCRTTEFDCLGLALIAEDGDSGVCCADCDHPLPEVSDV